METRPVYPDGKRETLFEEGIEFQRFVSDLFLKEFGFAIRYYVKCEDQYTKGESREGIEVKFDQRILETGNVSIEVAEKTKADRKIWTPSGILRRDNTWLYVQGNYDIVFLFKKATLVELYEVKYKSKVWEPTPTIRTFLLPLPEAKKYAHSVFVFK